MTSRSPEQVIRDYLSAPHVLVASQPTPGTTGWQAETSVGGCDARPQTIQFGKVRSIPQRQVHAVTFETLTGQRMSGAYSVHQDRTGEWQVAGGAGGGVNGSPRRDHPWVNLGGGGWPSRFYAGGHVLESGGAIVRVRLRAANGTVLEDTVDDELVLFLTDEPVHVPVYAELLDRNGQVVSQHNALG